jgi:hypothetical protein
MKSLSPIVVHVPREAAASGDAAYKWQPQPARTTNAAQTPAQRAAAGPVVRRTHIVTLIIPALGTLEHPISGTSLQVLSSPCPLDIQYDVSAGPMSFAPGFGIAVPKQSPFSLLVIKNPLSSSITIVLCVGWGKHKASIAPAYVVTPIEGWVACVTGVVTPLSTTPVYFRNGFFYGFQGAPVGAAPVNNAGSVNIGKTANLPDIVQSSQWVQYQAPPGQLYNLAKFNILGTSPDGIFYSLT